MKIKVKPLFLKQLLGVSIIMLSALCSYADEVEIPFKSGNLILSGSLITPKGDGPFPVVIFIHGSGPEDRSNSRSRAKEFAKNGIAAFIYDKRGVGRSEGDKNFPNYFSIDTLAQDANAAADMLMDRLEIKNDKIGFVACSQGGWVAPLAAALNNHISFMVIVSGSVSTIAEDNYFERDARLRSEGFTDEEVKEADAMHLVDMELSRRGKNFDEFVAMWNKYKSAKWFKRVYVSEDPNPADSKYRQWYRTVLDVDPRPSLATLNIPILWLYGDATLDRFCPVELSLKNLDELKKSGKAYQVITFPGANHSLLKKSKDCLLEDEIFVWLNSKL
ncbi:MAG TPA: alpha/beta hydrolase [Chitinophagaceae bacterium]|nr:alpha/beta hydrolase [Chitinophagaceae bacterium]